VRGRDGLIAILYTMSRSIVITSDLAPCMSVTHLCTTCLYITSLSLCLSVCMCVSLSHQPPSLAAYITSLSSSSESHTTAASATRSNHHTHTHTLARRRRQRRDCTRTVFVDFVKTFESCRPQRASRQVGVAAWSAYGPLDTVAHSF